MASEADNPFLRSGIAALSDLETTAWRHQLAILESSQRDFLIHEQEFRSPAYKWPRNALNNWSRVWEYPYVYFHLQSILEASGAHRVSRVVDFGSGVTFFPFAIARLGYHVICSDIDPGCSSDLERAASVVPHSPGRVEFRHIDGTQLPLEDAEVDAIYSISVIEHIPEFER